MLRVRVLGTFEIEGIPTSGFEGRKTRSLVRMLAASVGQPVHPDRLIDALWGDALPARPERELSVLASRARSVLGTDRLVRSDAGLALAADWFDLVAFDQFAAEARSRLDVGAFGTARSAAAAALALVRGPFVADEPGDGWVDQPREAVQRRVSLLRSLAAEAALADGSIGDAVAFGEAALADDPFDEAALRIVMRAHVAAGRPGSALAAYAALRSRLGEELGVSPTSDTEALHTAILVEEPLGSDRSPAPGRPAQAAALPALAGRRAELDRLDAALTRAAGAAQLVEIRGEAGIGKTCLVEHWATRAQAAGATVLSGRADELGAALALQPVADAIVSYQRAVGIDPGELLGDDAALLGQLLGLVAPAAEVRIPGPTATADAIQTSVFAALARTVPRLGGEGPTALVLDDAHLAGASTLAWLAFVLRRRADIPLLIVAVRRRGEGSDLPSTEVVDVGPLDRDAAREVIGADRLDDLFRRSGGNPLFLVELAQSSDDHVPESIVQSVSARCAQAGDIAPTLRTAAILGDTVDLGVLAEVLDRSPLTLISQLEDAVARGFLEERDGRFGFRHALVREALAADTAASRHALVHREAARVLSARADANPLDVARHARLAGDRSLAARSLVVAAAQAAARLDLAGTEELLDEAIDLDDHAEARLQRARVRIARNDLDAADLDAVAATDGDRVRSLELRAWIARHRHDMASAIRLGREGARLAADPAVRASCLVAVAFAHRGIGELVEADEVLREAEACDPPLGLGVSAWVGVLRVHQGRVAEGLDRLEPASDSRSAGHSPFWVEHVLQMTAHGQALEGRVADALATLDHLDDEMARRGSDRRYAGMTSAYRSWIVRNLGDPEALTWAERARSIAGLAEPRAQGTLDLADVHLHAGRLDLARAALDEASALMSPEWFHNRWRCEERLSLLEARLALADDQAGVACEFAEGVVADASARGDRRYATLGRLVLARATGRDGAFDPEAVEPDLDALRDVAGPEAWWVIAELASEAGVDRWWALAEQAVDSLASGAGDRSTAFRTYASSRLDDLRAAKPVIRLP